jgi:hypothetical protein
MTKYNRKFHFCVINFVLLFYLTIVKITDNYIVMVIKSSLNNNYFMMIECGNYHNLSLFCNCFINFSNYNF